MRITRDIVWVSFLGPVVGAVSCKREDWDGSEIRQTYPSCRTVAPGGLPGPELVNLKTKAEFRPIFLIHTHITTAINQLVNGPILWSKPCKVLYSKV